MEDNILYHYTSLEVLKCLFSNYSQDNPYLTFWATNCAFMNDPKEISECIDLIKIAITGISCPRLRQRAYNVFNNDKIKDAMLFFSTIAKSEAGIPYAVSLSKNKDNINMWQMYGDKGRGVALGFNRDKITGDGFELVNCIYNDNDIKGMINEIRKCIKVFFEQLDKQTIDIPQSQYEFICSLRVFSKIAAQIKNKAYNYEKESRLLTQCPAPEFRVVNNIIKPYTIVKVPVESLNSIVLGPAANKQNISSLQLFFLSKGLSDIASNITESAVPYRD